MHGESPDLPGFYKDDIVEAVRTRFGYVDKVEIFQIVLGEATTFGKVQGLRKAGVTVGRPRTQYYLKSVKESISNASVPEPPVPAKAAPASQPQPSQSMDSGDNAGRPLAAWNLGPNKRPRLELAKSVKDNPWKSSSLHDDIVSPQSDARCLDAAECLAALMDGPVVRAVQEADPSLKESPGFKFCYCKRITVLSI